MMREKRAFLDEESDEKLRLFAAYINKPEKECWNEIFRMIDWPAICLKIEEKTGRKKEEANKKQEEEEKPSWD